MKFSASVLAIALSFNCFSQSLLNTASINGKEIPEEILKDWFNSDYEELKLYGTATNKTFAELIKDQEPKKKMVVAVIDSGVDWEHEDLSSNIWINEDEIPNNNIDDDQNGYVDDVHGWNFLVNDSGEDINGETLEATRILQQAKIIKEQDSEYPKWMTQEVITQAIKIFNENVDQVKGLQSFRIAYAIADSVMLAFKGEDYKMEDASALDTAGNAEFKRAQLFFGIMSAGKITREALDEMAEVYDETMLFHLNMDLVNRKSLSLDQKIYGNNHYEGDDATHGTHVAGIIASNRNNDFGSRGIASNCASIMIIRAVPNGDEHDIDVINAIRYAVDNGANIINMSFGKGLSPYQADVTAAMKYAMDNNVLVIHAAGNDSDNNDEVGNFPNIKTLDNHDQLSYLTIGAIAPEKNKNLLASFTNYGIESIDLFAPGQEIYATTPNNEYDFLSGTSMAAPVVSGIAALVWAYHPELNALELKNVLIDSATELPKKKVILPGTKKDKVKLNEISKTAGLVNTYNAFMQLK